MNLLESMAYFKPNLRSLAFPFILSGLVFAQAANGQAPANKDPYRYLLKKGGMYAGLTFSINNSRIQNDERLIAFIEDRKRKSFGINLDAGYFIKDNWAVGGLLNFGKVTREGREINSQNQVADIAYVNEQWGIFSAMKNYIPLDPKNRFFLYNLALLGGTIENELLESTSDGILTRKYVKNRSLELRIAPGLMVNVIKGFGIEVGAEIAGIKYKWSDTDVNNTQTTTTRSFSADLTINLLRLNLGFYYYFGL